MQHPLSQAGSQAEVAAMGNKQTSSAHPLTSKKVSDHLANERTFLAWVRTGLATITFGFVVDRLPNLSHLMLGKTQAVVASSVPFSAIVRISLTLLGMAMMVVALLNFLHNRSNIDRDAFHPPSHFVILLTILARMISLLLVVYLILTV